MIDIQINGEATTLQENTTINQLLTERFGTNLKGIAVAFNGRLAKRMEWVDLIISEGDTIEILHAVAGG
jgi:thiamine biosynthesis protein ThiS